MSESSEAPLASSATAGGPEVVDLDDLVYDWNAPNRRGPLSPLRGRKVSFFDETLGTDVIDYTPRERSERGRPGRPVTRDADGPPPPRAG